MAGITLLQAETQLALYLAAETNILAGQRVSMNGRDLTLANLKEVQEGISIWNKRAQALGRTASGLRVREVIPR
jgi:hypothetical protein